MIRVQVVEQPGSHLFRTLVAAMRSGDLRTLELKGRGRRVRHKSSPGWMSWSHRDGVIDCQIFSPRKEGEEWGLFSSFMGRLADRYSDKVLTIGVQFPREPEPSAKRRRGK